METAITLLLITVILLSIVIVAFLVTITIVLLKLRTLMKNVNVVASNARNLTEWMQPAKLFTEAAKAFKRR